MDKHTAEIYQSVLGYVLSAEEYMDSHSEADNTRIRLYLNHIRERIEEEYK